MQPSPTIDPLTPIVALLSSMSLDQPGGASNTTTTTGTGTLPSSFYRALTPPTYNGVGNDKVHDWLDELTEYYDVTGVTDPLAQVKGAKVLLRGNARAWSRRTDTTTASASIAWDHFKTLIIRRFGSPNKTFMARDKLYGLKQTKSATNYIYEFEKLQAQIETLSEEEAITLFIRGLKPKLQEHFAGNPELRMDLSKMMEIAESLDNVIYKTKENQNYWIRPTPPGWKDEATPMDLDVLMEQHAEIIAAINQVKPQVLNQHYTQYRGDSRRRNPGQQKQQDYANKACFVCHRPGHQAKGCPVKTETGKARSQ